MHGVTDLSKYAALGLDRSELPELPVAKVERRPGEQSPQNTSRSHAGQAPHEGDLINSRVQDLYQQNDIKEALLEPGTGKSGATPGVTTAKKREDPAPENSGCWYCLRRCLRLTDARETRRIGLNGKTTSSYASNQLNNRKYNPCSFLPLVLYNEFKFFFNLFFLIIALTQFVPGLKVGLLVTYIAPLAFVLTVTMLKEAYDDLQRYMRDIDLNNTKYEVVTDKKGAVGGLKEISAESIKVGHIIKIYQNQRIPADLLLLKMSGPATSIFLRTDQLDGETDWKPRKPVPQTQKCVHPIDMLKLPGTVIASPPSEEIYTFLGQYQEEGQKDIEPLSLENTMWQNTVLASSGHCFGLVLYTGVETRTNMAAKTPRSKMGRLDEEVNWMAKVLFGVMLAMSLLIIILDSFTGAWWTKLFRALLLLTSIIPISLRINLDFAKLYYAWLINNDPQIPNTLARNSNIPEELGRIQFLLSDKTGTLTQNDMIFKKLALEWFQYSDENIEEMRDLLRKGLKNHVKPQTLQDESDENSDGGPDGSSSQALPTSALSHDGFANNRQALSGERLDSIGHERQYSDISSSQQRIHESSGTGGAMMRSVGTAKPVKVKGGRRRKGHKPSTMVTDCVLALILCHNVTPVTVSAKTSSSNGDKMDNKNANDIDSYNGSCESEGETREFQASSPDEVALVKFAEELGMKLLEREESKVVIQDTESKRMEYDIIANFPFSSDTKRMGIILRDPQGRIIFYLKGAEVVMRKKVQPHQRSAVDEIVEGLALNGLRALVVSQKTMSEAQLSDFQTRYKAASAALENREDKKREVLESIEDGMEFLCVTGVEDKLQENVMMTIEKFRAAGIQVWMLTGDKVETALCIAIATGMTKKDAEVFVFTGEKHCKDDEPTLLADDLHKYQQKNNPDLLLMVDGVALARILSSPQLTDRFFKAAAHSKSVCICRCSPKQKAEVARNVRLHTDKRIACVGDGGNDVAMIQEADVGLGIVGKEGKQASLASDFSLDKFCYLQDLIIWHGRMSYQRSAMLTQFVLHRGMIISFCQALFTLIYFSVIIQIFNGYLLIGFSTVYTMLPVFSLVLNQDIERETCLRFPILYQSLQAGRMLNLKTFLSWTWKSIYQAAIIMFFTILLFNDSFVVIISVSFTSLIVIEMLNVLQESTNPDKRTYFLIALSLTIYFATITGYSSLFQMQSIFDLAFVWRVALIVFFCWFPPAFTRWLVTRYDPSPVDKIRREEEERLKQERLKRKMMEAEKLAMEKEEKEHAEKYADQYSDIDDADYEDQYQPAPTRMRIN